MAMVILGALKLADFIEKYSDAKGWINHWRREVEATIWKSPQDIKDRYASASFLPNRVVVFNVKGNKFRLVTQVNYDYQKVLIKWVGTHAEYDKEIF